MTGTTRRPATSEAEEKAQKARDAGLRKAYSEATAQLRSQRQDEFNGLYKAAAAARGIEWTPKQSPEQKAAEQIDALLAQFPHLKERFSDEATEMAGSMSESNAATT